ncbi:MAG: sigma-70 family RNA polymerase sigma factor [Thermoleophilia bacterium]|nr:sigma-70 family RNA polymerase sigma factor [Thermoleophilia bacterium]
MESVDSSVGSEDELRFRRLFADHYRAVLAYALRRCAQRADAEDVAAESFAVAWRRVADTPADPDRERAWLLAIAARVLANQRRSRRRLLGLLERLQGEPPQLALAADESAGTRERHAEVFRALRRLPSRDRELLCLVAWEQLTIGQVGEVLGCTPNAASIRLHRARRRLASELAKAQGTSGHEEIRPRSQGEAP